MNFRKGILAVAVASFFILPVCAFGAALSITPLSSSIGVGETISVSVMVSSTDQAMNAVSGAVSFPADKLEVVSVAKTGSILTLWVQEPFFSNSAGTVSFEGVVPNPGFLGSLGKIVTITFRSKSAGSAPLSFPSSSVLANDGLGTEILTSSAGATVTVRNATTPPRGIISDGEIITITSPTHPDQDAWYRAREAQFNWQNTPNAIAVRLGYGLNSQGVPQVNYQPPISQRTLELEDGTTYFSLQERTSAGWSDIFRYRVQIDTVAPESFTIETVPKPENADRTFARFLAHDKLSGISTYELVINGKTWKSILPPDIKDVGIELPQTGTGMTTLKVVAFDKAGNATSAETQYFSAQVEKEISTQESPAGLGTILRDYAFYVALIVLIGFGLLALVWYVSHRLGKYRVRTAHRIAQSNRALRTELLELRDTVKEDVRFLREARAKRSLTEDEEQFIRRFNQLLNKLERTLEKELTASRDVRGEH